MPTGDHAIGVLIATSDDQGETDFQISLRGNPFDLLSGAQGLSAIAAQKVQSLSTLPMFDNWPENSEDDEDDSGSKN